MEHLILVEDWTGDYIWRIPYAKLKEWKSYCNESHRIADDNCMGESFPEPETPEWAEPMGIIFDRHY